MNKVASRLVSGIGRVSWLLGAASAVTGFVVVGVVVYGVVMRYVFKSPTVYSLELPEVLFIAMVALCLAYTQTQGRHVRVEIVTSRLRGRVQDALAIFTSITTLGYCVIVAWALSQRAAWNLAKDIGTIEAHVPLAPFSIVIVVGICLMGLLLLTEVAGLYSKVTRRG